MKVVRFVFVIGQAFLVVSFLSLVATFILRSEMTGRLYLWAFAAYAVALALALILLVPARIYDWLRGRAKLDT